MSGVAPRVQVTDSIPFIENNPSDPTTKAPVPLSSPHTEGQAWSLLQAIFSVADLGRDGNTPTVKGMAVLRLYGALWDRGDFISRSRSIAALHSKQLRVSGRAYKSPQ
jgi:hypothetical protein